MDSTNDNLYSSLNNVLADGDGQLYWCTSASNTVFMTTTGMLLANNGNVFLRQDGSFQNGAGYASINGADGEFRSDLNTGTPTNPTTPVKWIAFNSGGVQGFIPWYQ
jgi:hypothetical protein